jgi:hypothetical protein
LHLSSSPRSASSRPSEALRKHECLYCAQSSCLALFSLVGASMERCLMWSFVVWFVYALEKTNVSTIQQWAIVVILRIESITDAVHAPLQARTESLFVKIAQSPHADIVPMARCLLIPLITTYLLLPYCPMDMDDISTNEDPHPDRSAGRRRCLGRSSRQEAREFGGSGDGDGRIHSLW